MHRFIYRLGRHLGLVVEVGWRKLKFILQLLLVTVAALALEVFWCVILTSRQIEKPQ